MQHWVADLKAQGVQYQNWSPLPRKSSTLKTDPGSEFLSAQLNAFLLQQGIKREFVPSKAHCDMIERAIRTVKEATTSLLQNAKFELTRAAAVRLPNAEHVNPYIFWCEASSHAIDVLNKMPYLKDKKLSRNQMWNSVTTNAPIEHEDLSMLRTFGCRVYCKNYESLKPGKGGVQPSKATQEAGMKAFPTWGNKGWEGIFVGLSKDTPGCWRVLNLRTKQYVDTNHMIANENMQTSLPPQKLTRDSLLTLLQLHAFYPLSIAQQIAIDQLAADNKHLLHDDWYFDYHENDPQPALDAILEAHRKARYEALKRAPNGFPPSKKKMILSSKEMFSRLCSSLTFLLTLKFSKPNGYSRRKAMVVTRADIPLKVVANAMDLIMTKSSHL